MSPLSLASLLVFALAGLTACSQGRILGGESSGEPRVGDPGVTAAGGGGASSGGGGAGSADAAPAPVHFDSIYPESVLCPLPDAPPPGPALSPGYASTCAGCHGPAGEGHPATDSTDAVPALASVPTLAEFTSIVRGGRNKMPAF